MPAARRQRLTIKRREVLAELERKIALASDLNQKHLSAHKKLEELHQQVSQAQTAARQAAKEAAEIEMEAIKAANEVRSMHLALGTVTIGTFRTIHLSNNARRNNVFLFNYSFVEESIAALEDMSRTL